MNLACQWYVYINLKEILGKGHVCACLLKFICCSIRKDWEVARKKEENSFFPKDEMRQKNYSYYLVFEFLGFDCFY